MISKHFLEKHKKYKEKYGKDELYWGFGIENEMYLQFEKKAIITSEFFHNNHKPERYSLDYFDSYKNKVDFGLQIELPILVNSHTFLYTDENNEHNTTFEKIPQPNKKFKGKSIHDILMEKCPYFSSHYDENFVYDGDTIEFITQNFYKVSIKEVLTELTDIKKNFIDSIQPIFPFKEYGKINLMFKNYPVALHLTNMKNIAIFNNGTYHFNFTLPTFLDESGEIKDKQLLAIKVFDM